MVPLTAGGCYKYCCKVPHTPHPLYPIYMLIRPTKVGRESGAGRGSLFEPHWNCFLFLMGGTGHTHWLQLRTIIAKDRKTRTSIPHIATLQLLWLTLRRLCKVAHAIGGAGLHWASWAYSIPSCQRLLDMLVHTTTLPWHCHGATTALPWHCHGKAIVVTWNRPGG